MYKIYLLKGDLNDATDYYLNIISKSIKNIGATVNQVYTVKEIFQDDIVITIHPKAFLQVWRQNNKQKIIHWFQGVIPEEAMLLFENSPLKKYPRKWYYSYLERFILKRAFLVFFVSKAMFCHYQKKYCYDKTNYLIMPCFNQVLVENVFNEARYKRATFVYAGSMSKWQCIEETLQLFKQIKSEVIDAKLTLLTKEQEQAQFLLDKYDLLDTEVKYVPYTELNTELSKYKFGFIIREDHVVNNVATPTKMNSYLANGVIPIYSDYIHDFKENLLSYKYLIPFSEGDNYLQAIKDLDKVSSIDVYKEYKMIFDTYYNKDQYISNITQVLKSYE